MMPTPAQLQDVTVTGELLRRAELNFRRLHDPEFQFDAMIHAFTAKEAPGDWVGRELLALEFPVRFSAVPPQNPTRMAGHRRFAHGPLLLGDRSGAAGSLAAGERFAPLGGARYRCEFSGREIGPLPSLIDLTETEAKASSTQILFPDSLP